MLVFIGQYVRSYTTREPLPTWVDIRVLALFQPLQVVGKFETPSVQAFATRSNLACSKGMFSITWFNFEGDT